MTEQQDFEIISDYSDDYMERINAIDSINDFKTLENIFISDEYITVRAKAFDRLTTLFEKTSKYRKMIRLWNEITTFKSWITFEINHLGRGNNIERSISWILNQYNENDCPVCHRKDYLQGKKIVADCVHVIIYPRFFDNKFEIVSRQGDYGPQYQYEMVIRVLILKDFQYQYDYHFARCWYSHKDGHIRFYNKIVYQEEK